MVPTFIPPADDTVIAGQTGSLAARYLAAPFSVLDARTGWWRERKAAWVAAGIQSELGRGGNLAFATSAQPPDVYEAKWLHDAAVGRKTTWPEFAAAHPERMRQAGTSVFDPVLCELVYRWFSAPGGLVLDPFAGGSVRGLVAAATGRHYIGIDLRGEQVDANKAQWAAAVDWPRTNPPDWRLGDAAAVASICAGLQADLLFSCPPYGDLERYSEDPADLSTMRYPNFLRAYRQIIKDAVHLLARDRFACFVVGDIRDSKGLMRGFVGDTVEAFRAAGAQLYNEAILVTPAGSLAIRAGKPFKVSRKLGRSHQHVLVFCKGDPRKAAEACGAVR